MANTHARKHMRERDHLEHVMLIWMDVVYTHTHTHARSCARSQLTICRNYLVVLLCQRVCFFTLCSQEEKMYTIIALFAHITRVVFALQCDE